MGHFAFVFGASVSLFNLCGLNEVPSLTHDTHSIIVGIILIKCLNAMSLENAVSIKNLFPRAGPALPPGTQSDHVEEG